MNISIIGDSHVAALRNGWDQVKGDFPAISLKFFAQRRDGLKDLRADGPLLVASTDSLGEAFCFTSGGEDTIDTRQFDAILVHGLKGRPFFWDNTKFYSQQAVEQSLYDATQDTLSYRIVSLICSVSPGKVYVGHNPLPTHKNAPENQDLTLYHSGIKLVNERVYRPLGARMITQPASTIVGQFYTDSRFRKGARRLAVGANNDDQIQPASDRYHHMNGDFGGVLLSEFFRNLSTGKFEV